MRVVLPALLDAFECADADCACRRAWRAAAAGRQPAADRFPFREAEDALVRGAAVLARADESTVAPSRVAGDAAYLPIAAVATPAGAELYFSSRCAEVRALLASNDEPVDLARAEGGWRAPLAVFQPADQLKQVRLHGKHSLPWRSFQALRETLLDLLADPTHLPLGRLARVACLVDQVVTDQAVPAQVPPLTARHFLAFRGWLEGRVAAADATAMGHFHARAWPLWPELTVQPDDPAWHAALAGDWRVQLRRWLVPVEQDLAGALEACVALRLFAVPLGRDQTLQRGYAEVLESVALGLRWSAALAEVEGAPVTAEQLVAGLSLAEALVATSAAPLPAFSRPADSHERGPRMIDLDMTWESIC
jgi:hypothetical protein